MSTPAETESPAPPVAPEERIENADTTSQNATSPATNPKEADETAKTTPPSDEANSNKPNLEESNSSSPKDKEGSPSPSQASSDEEGEVSESEPDHHDHPPLPNEPLPGDDAPPLPNEPLPGTDTTNPPLPSEPTPAAQEEAEPVDDGWGFVWNPNDNQYWFYNRFTGVWQLENPRAATTTTPSATIPSIPSSLPVAAPIPPNTDPTSSISNPTSISGGYNPAIHGSYDENAWYAVNARALQQQAESSVSAVPPAEYAVGGFFNKQTGQWQMPEQGVERHSDEAKSRRQLNAYFDVDAAANMHDGRSLKAERSGKKPSRKELREFKEKRRAKKEEKRRAWLRD
ncbi:hypothetical protein B0T21DRAFT_278963 [Apiosordaria backusii]|uniref:WW domain-containing protein n=1 Tax=Apiosordaria backusii TaxID=314023 RepID=A0AA40F043_9PEZI|nr:hypothetical protein B0T21DRAFT_278963 [Apiosordaria backusii]